ncbi:hypothetical protein OSJ57_13940 [Sphingomonas sp. HH69]|jgi:hypothetical protein
MLADSPPLGAVGAFDEELHEPSTFLNAILEFIGQQLTVWRDDPKRKKVTAETALTAQLCRFLNGATRKSRLDHINFQTEVPDTVKGNRSLDLAPAPSRCTIWIGGREYSYYDVLIPIECKRLPTPKSKTRERREYLHTFVKKGGGVQRFREGLHGADHEIGAMIGYVQSRTAVKWFATLNCWIAAFERKALGSWSRAEQLHSKLDFPSERRITATSNHPRDGSPIELRHLLIEM